jgi:hypothetical protein
VKPLAEVAQALMNGDGLVVRQWAQDCLRDRTNWTALRKPAGLTGDALSVAAGLVELMADRTAQAPPPWASSVPAVTKPIYLVPERMRRSREVSEREGPAPLRRRHVFAMPDYLDHV